MNSDIERQFVGSFVQADKKDRLLGFFASKTKRWKGLLELSHADAGILDMRYGVKVSKHDAMPGALFDLLKSKGAPKECYIFSNCKSIDQQWLPLDLALEKVCGIGIGTVISCIPGRLALFEGELFPDEYVFEVK